MKRIIRCLNCGNVAKFYGSYIATLTERTTSILTGEIKEQELKGKICRSCYQEIYKSKHEKEKKV